MLKNTFIHLPGIGRVTEKNLWQNGILTWNDLEECKPKQLELFRAKRWRKPNLLAQSKEALKEKKAEFFAERLPSSEHYRIALAFPEDTLYLDIETTGLSRYYDHITMVGWELNGEYGAYIRGDDTDEMQEVFDQAKVVVTFNGARFDLPFLRQEFGEMLDIPECHIDLVYLARRVDLTGGQKEIEKRLNIQRAESLKGMGGGSAPILWHQYRWGDEKALERLIQYNHADVRGMRIIIEKVSRLLLEEYEAPSTAISLCRNGRAEDISLVSLDDTEINIVSYAGNPGPVVRYKDLNLNDSLRIVGIDLTGSSDRPSGWCLLEGSRATTKLLSTDEELLEATIQAEPTLVSIDSPLSIPKGRTRVDDSDPAREEYGIMRECERTLKKRGVNVYPCLIPSMQRLTKRGMRLAQTLREKGIPVIESYPGAAQDILRIPRKQAGLEYLTQGLKRFGLHGEYVNTSVSHDELDAITSALVGLFFWSGKFERLGNEAEDYLIIPDVDDGKNQWSTTAIGLSGPIYAGKTTAGRILESIGYCYGRYSQVIKWLAEKHGLEPDRDNLQEIGEEIYKDKGQRWLGSQLLERLPKDCDLVIDGLRHPEDHAFLVERFGPNFLHVTIHAKKEERLARYLDDGYTREEFHQVLEHPVEQNVQKVQSLAHKQIDNNSSEDDYQQKLLELIYQKHPLSK